MWHYSAGKDYCNQGARDMESLKSFVLSFWDQYPWVVIGIVVALGGLALVRPKEFGKLLLAAGVIVAVIYVVSMLLDVLQSGTEGREKLIRDPNVSVEPGSR